MPEDVLGKVDSRASAVVFEEDALADDKSVAEQIGEIVQKIYSPPPPPADRQPSLDQEVEETKD